MSEIKENYTAVDRIKELIQADDRIRIFYDIDLTVDQMQRFKDLQLLLNK